VGLGKAVAEISALIEPIGSTFGPGWRSRAHYDPTSKLQCAGGPPSRRGLWHPCEHLPIYSTVA